MTRQTVRAENTERGQQSDRGQRRQGPPKRKRTGRKILIFVVLVSAVQIIGFYHYNSLLTAPTHIPDSITIPRVAPVNTTKQVAQLEQQYPISSVSNDGTYFAYVDTNNVLHIKDLANNTELPTVVMSYPAHYISWMQDEIVFVGEQEAPGELVLQSVEANGGTARTLHTWAGLDPSSVFKKISYTLLTNDTYVLIGTDSASAVYHFDTNGDFNYVDLGGRYIRNIDVTQTNNVLYFEDYANGSFNVLSESQGQIQVVKLNSALVAVVNNTLYYGAINQNGLVTAVYKYDSSTSTGTLVSTLQTPTLASQITVTADGQVQVNTPSA